MFSLEMKSLQNSRNAFDAQMNLTLMNRWYLGPNQKKALKIDAVLTLSADSSAENTCFLEFSEGLKLIESCNASILQQSTVFLEYLDGHAIMHVTYEYYFDNRPTKILYTFDILHVDRNTLKLRVHNTRWTKSFD